VATYDRDPTPVATIRPIGRGEIAGIDDLVEFSADDQADRTRRRRRWKIVRRSVLAVVLLVVGYYAVTLFQVYRTGRSDQARPVDAVVVLGAAQYDGTPSPQLAARLDHVVALYQQGVAPLVVVTGGKQPDDRFTEAEASQRYLVERGVPAEAIVAETAGGSTYESIAGAADLLDERGLDSVVVVTDPYHALRSRLIAEERGLTAFVSPTPTSVVRGGNDVRRHLLESGGVALGRLIGFDNL
jgi:vancomycin permeability regulator SanA